MEARVPKSNHQSMIILSALSHKDKVELCRKIQSFSKLLQLLHVGWKLTIISA